IDCNDRDASAISFLRRGRDPGNIAVCVCNFTPVPRPHYRVGVPLPGLYRELLNSDAACYGGSNLGNGGAILADTRPWHGRPYSPDLTLPPLSALILRPE